MKLTSLVLSTCLALTSISAVADIKFDHGQRTKQDLKRDMTAKPSEIMAFSGVKKGMTVLDIFGGGGYYSELLSQVVGSDGKVYLHNNKAYLSFVGKELDARVKGDRLKNVVDHKAEAEDLDIPDASLDAIFYVLGYNDLYHKSKSWQVEPQPFLDQLYKALKPGGLLLVADHSAPEGTNTAHSQKLHRIDELYVKKELTSKGFSFVKDSQVLRNPEDSRLISPFRPEIRRNTDRFVMLFAKPAER
ncbi:MAG: putative methyltransferase [Phenylobacterium sp.]|jgi:predicted methyltransferase